MDTNMVNNNENLDPNGESTNQNGSSSTPRDTTEYIKPWMKNLGKSFAQNEEIAKYDSLTDCVAGLLKRPEAKQIPERYSNVEDEKLQGIFKKAGVTESEAKSINDYYNSLVPKKATLEEVFGENLEKTMKSYEKGKTVLKDIADEAEKNGLDKDPTFVKLMAIIGDESAEGRPFVAPNTGVKKSAVQMLIESSWS